MVMDACHRAAELFRVWGTREAAGRIGWTRCVIGAPLAAWLLFRPVQPRLRELKPGGHMRSLCGGSSFHMGGEEGRGPRVSRSATCRPEIQVRASGPRTKTAVSTRTSICGAGRCCAVRGAEISG